jgi:hypothetical protein
MGEKIREDKEAMGGCRLLDAQAYSLLGLGKEPHGGGVPGPKGKLYHLHKIAGHNKFFWVNWIL